MRVFIVGLGSTLADELVRLAQDAGLEVVGTVSTKGQQSRARRKLLAHPSNDHELAVAEPVALQSDKVAWSKLVQKSDVVVASLVDDAKIAIDTLRVFEKPKLESEENDEDPSGSGLKRFIAISSVLTWSRNPPFAKGEDGPVGHREDDFKTRKPAPAYAELKTSETQVLTARRTDELETCVVASGVLYGGAQSALGMLFRQAWMHPTQPLTVPSVAGGVAGGMNMIPMISIYDLASVISRLVSTGGPGGSPLPKRYIAAVDHASRSTTLRDICLGISKVLGNCQIRDIASPDEADALLLDEDDGAGIATLQLNLTFDTESEGAVDQLVTKEEWKHRDGGLLGNLPFFARDFVRAMDLRPLKTVVLGAPRVGKSTLASNLARRYYLPLLTPQSLLDELFPAGEAQASGDEAGGEGVSQIDEDVATLQEQLAEWKSGAASIGTIPDASLIALLRWKLRSSTCRNQGYVLDGFPISLEQAKGIFDGAGEDGGKQPDENNADGGSDGSGEATSSEPADSEAPPEGELSPADLAAARTQQLLSRLKPSQVVQVPNRVIVLNAPRELLERRAQSLSEEEAEATGNTLDAFARRAELFESECERVADYFERRHTKNAEKTDAAAEAESNEAGQEEEGKGASIDKTEEDSGVEVLELHLPTESAFCDEQTYDEPIRAYMEQGGAPFNFHPTRDEVRKQKHEQEEKQRQDDERRRREAQEREESEERGIRARLAADKARLELLEREEAALLEARAKPLRAYLMDTVLPALTEGMLEVVKVQPEDPIDYLAEFLFRKGQEMETQAASEAS